MNLNVSPLTGVPPPTGKRGRPKNSLNLYSKQPSSIATRLKKAGIDWVVDLANAIKTNDTARIALWMRMLPYLIVTRGHPLNHPAKTKKKTSSAALAALAALEQEQ